MAQMKLLYGNKGCAFSISIWSKASAFACHAPAMARHPALPPFPGRPPSRCCRAVPGIRREGPRPAFRPMSRVHSREFCPPALRISAGLAGQAGRGVASALSCSEEVHVGGHRGLPLGPFSFIRAARCPRARTRAHTATGLAECLALAPLRLEPAAAPGSPARLRLSWPCCADCTARPYRQKAKAAACFQ